MKMYGTQHQNMWAPDLIVSSESEAQTDELWTLEYLCAAVQ